MITIPANTAFKPFAPVFTLQTVEAAAVATLKISVDGVAYTDYPGGAAETFTGSQVFSDYPTGAFLKCDVAVHCTVPCVIVPLTYTVTVNAVGCTVTGTGSYEAGSACTLQVFPNRDYRFEGWADGYEENTRTFFVNSDVTLSVTCVSDLTVYSFLNDGHCSCQIPGPPPTVVSSYSGHPGDTVTIKVVPNPGYSFNGWGDGVVTNPRKFTLGYRDLTFRATAWASQIHIIPAPSGNIKIKGVTGDVDTWYTWDEISRPGTSHQFGWVNPAGTVTVYTENKFSLAEGQTIYTGSGASSSCGTVTEIHNEPAPTFYLNNVGGNNPNLQIRCDAGSWQDAPTTAETAVEFSEHLYLRGTNLGGFSHSESEYSQFVFTGYLLRSVSGGINSLISYGGKEIDHIPSAHCFYKLFAGAPIQSISALSLPSLDLTYGCYQQMFEGCTQLTNSTALPATKVTTRAYYQMFQGCTALTDAPALPATDVAVECYRFMFKGCTSLVAAPTTLPADNLPDYCYANMFEGCTSLNSVPTLPATKVVGRDVYSWMFKGCTSLVNAGITINIDDISAYESDFWCMFNGCSALTSAPTIKTTKVGWKSMAHMFEGCTSLVNGPVLRPRTLGSECYLDMFKGCTQLNSLYCYAEDISASECLSGWLTGVAATGTFHRANDNKWSVLWERTGNGIPEGWTVTPEFPWIELTSTDATLYMKHEGGNYPSLYYYVFGTAHDQWMGVSTNANSPTVLPNDHKVWLRAENTGWSWSSETRSRLIFRDQEPAEGYVYITAGNVMSLICKSGYEIPTELPSSYCFNGLFEGTGDGDNQNRLYGVCYGFLPAETLTEGCYAWMFKNTRLLTQIPALPAMNLAGYCYNAMFQNCYHLGTGEEPEYVGLTVAPNLPATTLVYDCYLAMFEHCRALTTVDANMLHATTLKSASCERMFEGCLNLTAAPILLSRDVPQYGYKHMFYNCNKLSSVYCYCTSRSGKSEFDNWMNNAGTSAESRVFHGTKTWNFNRDASGVPINWTYLKDLD